MIKKLLITLAMALITLTGYAQEFKIGNVKYNVLSDGSVEIKDARKAKEAYVIEPTVTDKKSGKTYTVSAIGMDAFKKAQITSITIPESVKKLGKSSFEGCKQLSSVSLSKNVTQIPNSCFAKCKSLTSVNLDGVKSIDQRAFSNSGLKEITIPASVTEIKYSAFYHCSDLTSFVVDESEEPLIFETTVFDFTPLQDVVVSRPIVYDGEIYENCNCPFSYNPALKSIKLNGNAFVQLPKKLLKGCSSLETIITDEPEENDQWIEFLNSIPSGKNITVMGTEYPVDKLTEYFKTRANIRNKMAKFEDAFINKSNTYEARIAINSLTDEERFNHPELILPSLSAVNDFLYDNEILRNSTYQEMFFDHAQMYLYYMLVKDGVPEKYIGLDTWAKYDYLNKDIDHTEDYEKMLRWTEKYIQVRYKDEKDFVSSMSFPLAFQLANLCGLGRWKEAAGYFPIVHKLVAKQVYQYSNFNYPEELTYIKDALNAHGYKVTAPPYVPPKKKQSTASSKPSAKDWMQFFSDVVVDVAVDHHKKKQEEKRQRKQLEEVLKKMNK